MPNEIVSGTKSKDHPATPDVEIVSNASPIVPNGAKLITHLTT